MRITKRVCSDIALSLILTGVIAIPVTLLYWHFPNAIFTFVSIFIISPVIISILFGIYMIYFWKLCESPNVIQINLCEIALVLLFPHLCALIVSANFSNQQEVGGLIFVILLCMYLPNFIYCVSLYAIILFVSTKRFSSTLKYTGVLVVTLLVFSLLQELQLFGESIAIWPMLCAVVIGFYSRRYHCIFKGQNSILVNLLEIICILVVAHIIVLGFIIPFSPKQEMIEILGLSFFFLFLPSIVFSAIVGTITQLIKFRLES